MAKAYKSTEEGTSAQKNAVDKVNKVFGEEMVAATSKKQMNKWWSRNK